MARLVVRVCTSTRTASALPLSAALALTHCCGRSLRNPGSYPRGHRHGLRWLDVRPQGAGVGRVCLPGLEPSRRAYSASPKGTSKQATQLQSAYMRLARHGLIPRLAVEKRQADSPTDVEPFRWTATLSVDELDIAASGQGPRRYDAEHAAATQLLGLLDRQEVIQQLATRPRYNINRNSAHQTVQQYYSVIGGGEITAPDLTRDEADDSHTCQLTCAGKPVGEPATAASQNDARDIAVLSLAQRIATGDPELYPAGLANPFNPSIVLSAKQIAAFRAFNNRAKAYMLANSQFRTPSSTFIDTCLAGLHVAPSLGRLLTMGVITRCLDPAIIYAVLEGLPPPADTEAFESSQDWWRSMAAWEGDHAGYHLILLKLRQKVLFGLTGQEPDSQPQNKIIPTNHELGIIKAIDAAAQHLEYHILSTGLTKFRMANPDSYRRVDTLPLHLRAQPYGGHHNSNIRRSRLVRQILGLAFGRNIAQMQPPCLIPYGSTQDEPRLITLKMNAQHVQAAQRVHVGFRPTFGSLKMCLASVGPLVVFSGRQHTPDLQAAAEEEEEGGEEEITEDKPISARYFTSLSSLEAFMYSHTAVPHEPAPGSPSVVVEEYDDDDIFPSTDHSRVIVNDWLPILVKSEARDVSHEEATALLLESRALLRQAYDTAITQFFTKAKTAIEFYDLVSEMLKAMTINSRQPD
ncbi:hypothetical protein BD289DRAFT_141661 [Coniella lustricola]|uniref:Uncharacterized protein n=1 Tax=Coniella lustricola TaxID=2025994 RepID=A0A2T2ZVD1_9PEZI|nr:hypothetical protein BD289DRAFT_141661 [Coniella lustricola]